MTFLSSLHTSSIDFLRTYKGSVTGMQFELPIPKNVDFMLKNACEIRTKRFEHRIEWLEYFAPSFELLGDACSYHLTLSTFFTVKSWADGQLPNDTKM